ncbi:MAG: transketolase [Rhodospirillales bacterium]|jgi:pyruvate dehydrogenase E1 component|nr:transketolase [Rhodospirillales bacterium]
MAFGTAPILTAIDGGKPHRRPGAVVPAVSPDTLSILKELERKALWLSCWMIHHANHVRPSKDGLKVGGHQASCASSVTALAALYLNVLRPEDRVAVKPHAAPVFHALQYLLGREPLDHLVNFRALGGAQSYPSRTKDADDVDFSTGSVGLGVGATLFAALAQDYVRLHGWLPPDRPDGRMIAVMGDAELDEGNVFEALLEGWKHDVRNLWWIIDYNRQSLDGVINDFLFRKIRDFFRTVGWKVVILKYGKRLEKAFEGPAGEALKKWIDDCPNPLYSALCFKGGAAWREHLTHDLGGAAGLKSFLDSHDDASLHALMTNLAGHDMESVLEAFHAAKSDAPHCFVTYTIKGMGLPLAGHKDNHAGLMTPDQMEAFRAAMGIEPGREWDRFGGLAFDEAVLRRFLGNVPLARARNAAPPPAVVVPPIAAPAAETMSTQEAFGRIMNDLGKRDDEIGRRIVTTSPDVTVSTNLGGWVNHKYLFHRERQQDVFRLEGVPSPQRWGKRPEGQHIELGIAENNLFLLLTALGLSDRLFGQRLLPVGALYDPFIARGLDALTYGCYADARFMVVGTPSGISLAPEGGAHQSVTTPLIGLGQPGLTAFEPAFADELAAIMEWGFAHIQAPKGGSVYLRLSTRPIPQPSRPMTDDLRDALLSGGYWLREPTPGAELAVIYTGVVAPEAMDAFEQIREDVPGAGLLAVTSADCLHADWRAARRARKRGTAAKPARIESLLGRLAPDAALVSVIDGHPATLAWIGGVGRHRLYPLGVERFGQSGDISDLYRTYGIDADAILDAVAAVCLERMDRSR